MAFGEPKMCAERISKNIKKPYEYVRFRHFEGSDLKVFVTFPLVLMHFVSDGKFRFRRAFGVTKKGKWGLTRSNRDLTTPVRSQIEI